MQGLGFTPTHPPIPCRRHLHAAGCNLAKQDAAKLLLSDRKDTYRYLNGGGVSCL